MNTKNKVLIDKRLLEILMKNIPELDIDNNRWKKQVVDIPEGYKVELVKEAK